MRIRLLAPIVAFAATSALLVGQPVAAAPPEPAATPSCTITGTPGPDLLRGTPGDDVICGLGGDDILIGGGGDDTLVGGAGRDRLSGGVGDDDLVGGTGPDRLAAGPGDDALAGGPGSDRGSGGPGDDVCTPDASLASCAVDTSRPALSSVSIPEVSQAGTTLVVTWTAADPGGIDATWGRVGGRNGWETWCFTEPATLVSGDSVSGVYALQCDIPATLPNGDYTVFLGAVDRLGNVTETEAQAQIDGGSRDIAAPALVTAPVLPVVAPGDTFTLRWELSDESGVRYTMAWVYAPIVGASPPLVGYDGRAGSVAGAPTLVSGDESRGVWEQAFTLSPDAPAGSYMVLLSVGDSVGNRSADIVGHIVVASG